MAPPRAPLMELSSQGQNCRKMSARQQTYGKHRRAVAAQAPLWDSPGNKDNAAEKATTPPGWPSNYIDAQLATGLEELAIASHDSSAEPGLAEIESRDTPDSATKATSHQTSSVEKCVLDNVDLGDAPGLVKVDANEVESKHTPTVVKYALDDAESQTTPALVKHVLRKAKSTNTTQSALKEVGAAVSTQLLPTSRRVTRRTNESALLSIKIDVTELLKQSYSHTKSSTKIISEVITFHDFARKLMKQFAVKKLSDGSFGDVYKLVTHASTNSSSKQRLEQLGGGVLKIIPLSGNTGVGSRKFSRVENVLSEVKVLRRLDTLHGFTRFRDVHVIQGRYPDTFVDAYLDFVKNVRPCDAPHPRNYDRSQLYAIIDMDDAGTDLASLESPNIFQIHDIFWAAVIVLAHGEANVEFEARDMHSGNICIRPFIRGGTMNIPITLLSSWSENQVRHLGLTETRITLIDYTLSRARLEDNSVAFFDLTNKTWLFAEHAKTPTLQQRAYIQVRDAIRAASANNPNRSKKEDWSLFVPRTNIIWLAYLLASLLEILDEEPPQGSNEACVEAQKAMLEKLQLVSAALELGAAGGNGEDAGLGSAGELLAEALAGVLLGKEEVEWYKQQLESER